MRINHNIASLNTYRQLSANGVNTQKSLEKLSSGLRINRAGDDAAGLAISEKMRAQIRGLDQASRNSQDAISLIQTAEGALSETHSILQRMRELTVQSANDTNTDTDRDEIQKEVNQLTSEINRIGNTTEFNTKKLLNGTISTTNGTVEIGALGANTTTIAGASITLNENSSLTAGAYSVVVSDVTTKDSTIDVDTNGVGNGIASVTVASTGTIAEGNYAVKLEQATSTVYDSGNSTLNSATTGIDGVSVGNTALNPADGPFTVEISRTDATANFTDVGTGLTSVAIAPGADIAAGSYTIKAEAVAGALNNTGTGATAVAGEVAIFNSIAIDSATFAGSADEDYQFYLEEVGGAATSGIFQVTLRDSAGAALSDAVVLDNNVQDYEFYSGAAKVGVSFSIATNANTTIDGLGGASAAPTIATFDVNTKLTLNDGTADVGNTTVLADAVAGNATITVAGDNFTIAHTGGSAITSNGSTATFDIQNTLTLDFDSGAETANVALGGTVSLTNGLTFTMSNDIADYADGATATIALGSDNVTWASLIDKDNADAQVAGTAQFMVAQSSTYNFGNGVQFNTAATLTDEELTFSVTDDVTTNATLKKGVATVETLSNISAGSLSFQSGELTMNITDKTNGTANFSITGAISDDSLSMQIGANNGQNFSIGIEDMRANALGISGTAAAAAASVTGASFTTGAEDVTDGTNNTGAEWALDVSDSTKASAAIEVIDNAIKTVSSERSKLGAFQNRLEHTINNLGTSSENLTAAESRVRDVDMAKEMMEFTKNNILSQAAQAMLAQANQQPQGVLQLLR